jgi:hypothetical protein
MFVGAYTIQERFSCQSKTTCWGFAALALAKIESGQTTPPTAETMTLAGGLGQGDVQPTAGPLGQAASMQGAPAEAAGRSRWTGERC